MKLDKKLTSYPASALTGCIQVPGDKSISHRALIIGSQAVGVTSINNILVSEDVKNTALALEKMGIKIERGKEAWCVFGRGIGGLQQTQTPIDMGNSGTGVRLLMGLVSSYPYQVEFTGDASLCKRPMDRVIKPLELMGVNFVVHEGGKLPITVVGSADVSPICYKLPVASAQIKSAILLAGLNCRGVTEVIEPVATRDHTERMLKSFGADIIIKQEEDGAHILLRGGVQMCAGTIDIAGDPSSAAFLVVAALICEDSSLRINNVCINPLRTGLYDILLAMGADIKFVNKRQVAGEPVADIAVKTSNLRGIEVAKDYAPRMIDEYPILAVAAACAEGKTIMRGLAELKVKESDRLAAIYNGLKACNVDCTKGDDYLIINGKGKKVLHSETVLKTHLDHRMAMSFLVMGMAISGGIAVDDASMISTSFPGFVEIINGLGGKIE